MRNKLILGLTGLSGIGAGKVDKKPKFDILRSTKGCGDPAQWYRLKDCVLTVFRYDNQRREGKKACRFVRVDPLLGPLVSFRITLPNLWDLWDEQRPSLFILSWFKAYRLSTFKTFQIGFIFGLFTYTCGRFWLTWIVVFGSSSWKCTRLFYRLSCGSSPTFHE